MNEPIDDPYALIAALNRDAYRVYQRDGYRIFLNVSESRHMAKRALGRYEPEVFAALAERLPPGGTFIDIGANKGDFSLFAAARLGPAGCVIAFEPHPDNAGWLRRSVALNDFGTVTLVETALAEADGVLPLHIGSKSGHHALSPRPRDRGTVDVAVTTLDQAVADADLERIDVIKIDVEGAEDRVLAGATETLTRYRPAILLDVHDGPPGWRTALATQIDALGYDIAPQDGLRANSAVTLTPRS